MTSKPKGLLKAFVPSSVLQSRMHKRVFMQFAEKIGFVYFGYVDQRSDEHRLMRGLTVSAKHKDNNYCVGSFEGYDVALVERHDTIHHPGKPSRDHTWIIMTFDLHSSTDVPHIFLGLHTHSDTFYAHMFTKFSQLSKVFLGTTGMYDHAFSSRYSLYTSPDKSIVAEQLIDPGTARTIGEHFGGMTVEINEGTVYLYAEHQRPTVALLEKMLKYGLWLARTLDYKLSTHQRSTQE